MKRRGEFRVKWMLAILVVSLLLWLYKNYNPYQFAFFPKCPFLYTTGLKCPGCGSQRAIYYLLNGQFLNATKENILLVLSIPYLFLALGIQCIHQPNNKILSIRKRLYGQKAIMMILVIIIAFWVLRNIIGGF